MEWIKLTNFNWLNYKIGVNKLFLNFITEEIKNAPFLFSNFCAENQFLKLNSIKKDKAKICEYYIIFYLNIFWMGGK